MTEIFEVIINKGMCRGQRWTKSPNLVILKIKIITNYEFLKSKSIDFENHF